MSLSTQNLFNGKFDALFKGTVAKEAFSEKVHFLLIEKQRAINSNSSSRLLNTRELLAAAFGDKVVSLKVKAPPGAVIEVYELVFGNLKASVEVTLYNHQYRETRNVNAPDTAITHNRMCSDLASHCRDAGIPDAEIISAQDLFNRLFVSLSQNTRYSVENDAGFWEVVYSDSRGEAQVVVCVEEI